MQDRHVRLLFVEDQAIDRINFERFVNREGLNYACSFADSVQTARTILDNSPLDIVLTDHNLGDGTAFDVLEAAGPEIPTIVITGSASAEIAVEAMKRGAVDYIVKDITRDYLKALPFTVNNALKARDAELALRRYHDELEAIVEQRTHSLRATNRRLELEIADHNRTAQELKTLSMVVEQSLNSILISDTDKKIIYANPKFLEISQYALDEVIGRDVSFYVSDKNPTETLSAIQQCLHDGLSWQGEIIHQKKNGEDYWEQATVSPFRADNKTISHYVTVSEDISLRREYQQKLLHQANYDSLTGMPNRLLAMDRLTQALRSSGRSNAKTVVMFMDLDRFKNVNDTLGHRIGDLLLKEVGLRLSHCLRREDTVARLGGDEFLLIINDFVTTGEIVAIANKILIAFKSPFSLDGKDVFTGISIGITVAPDDSNDPDMLLRFGDAAMYKAKELGRNRYQFYTQAMNKDAEDRLRIDSNLHTALENNEFEVFYQPIINLNNKQLTGAEALLRWPGAQLGNVPPSVFIPIAEENGLIAPIGEWVMRQACEQIANWSMHSSMPLDIAVNVSVRQFREKGFVEMVQSVLADTQIHPHQLHLEITERLLLEDMPEVDDTIAVLSAMGVRLSIDDFGTGYSSLSYLNRFSCDYLKIDRSFISRVDSDMDTAALTQAIITMGHSLNLKVIAEGVEEQGQLASLKALNCDMAQGYLIGKPVSARGFEQTKWFSGLKRSSVPQTDKALEPTDL